MAFAKNGEAMMMQSPSQKIAALVARRDRLQRYTQGCRRAVWNQIAVKGIQREIDALLPLVRAGMQKQGRLDGLYQ